MIDKQALSEAILLTNQGKVEQAEKIYQKLIKQEPENEDLLSLVGLFYVGQRDYAKAENYLQQACNLKETLGTVSALGICEYKCKKPVQAAKTLIHALEFGDTPEIYATLLNCLFETKNYNKAVEYSAKMHQLYPDLPASVLNMIKALTFSGKLAEAEVMCVNYLKENNDAAAFWVQLGFLKELIYSDDNQAYECYRIASELGYNEVFYNMAVSRQKLGMYKEAEDLYKKMLEYFPDEETVTTSLGMCYLTQKKFKEGYELFFKRDNNEYKMITDFEDEVLVKSDQGFGDNIQFVRYLPFLQEKTKKIYFSVREPLRELFQKNYPDVEFTAKSDIQTVRVTDLAYLLDMDFEHIPFSEGYLKSDKRDIHSDKLKVGLCWEAGSAGIRTMINRTINVRLFEDIMNMPGIQTYSFQVQDSMKGNEKYPQMINLSKDFTNFSDTAQALMAMDVVITVDTALAHLAGALGVKTFLMLPYAADWRWFDDTKTTPWYKSVEIFKQNDPISWEKPFGDIKCRLKEYSL